jgi:aryl-alcohol dehydrogenase-like predicted oxidoreductase
VDYVTLGRSGLKVSRICLGAMNFGVWSPLGGGILASRYRPGADPQPDTRVGRLLASGDPKARKWANDQLTDRNLEIAEEVGKVATELDTTPLPSPWPGCAAGPASRRSSSARTVEQLQQNLTAFDLELPPSWSPASTRHPGRLPPR